MTQHTTPAVTHSDRERLHVYQAMQAILRAPVTPEIKTLISDSRAKSNDPVFHSFLSLLLTENPTHREMAEKIYQQLEQELLEKASQVATSEERTLPTAPTVETPAPNPLPRPQTNVDIEVNVPTAADGQRRRITLSFPENMSPQEMAAAMQRAMADASQSDTSSAALPAETPVSVADSLALQEVSKAVDQVHGELADKLIEASDPFPDYRPWVSEDPNAEFLDIIVGEQDGQPFRKKYSVITADTFFKQSALLELGRIRAILLGVKEQTSVFHGFAHIVMLTDGQLLDGDRSMHRPIRFEYPGVIPHYNDHSAHHIPGVKNFLTLHEALQKGYTFLLDFYVKARTSGDGKHFLIASMGEEKYLLRRPYNPSTQQAVAGEAAFQAKDLVDLHVACSRMTVVGVLADRR